MSRKVKNVNVMLAQLARIQEQLRSMRELIEEEVGKGVTKLFIDGAGAEEIYAYVEKIIAGSGYLEYVKLKREKQKRDTKNETRQKNDKEQNGQKLEEQDELVEVEQDNTEIKNKYW